MKTLAIVEVSQKQAYIFSSNKLRDNIKNSAIIAYVTSREYFNKCADKLYQQDKNEVYCGGGHAVLVFDDHEIAKEFVRRVTFDVLQNYPGLELFAKLKDCEREPNADSIEELKNDLEKKKAIRRASFVQGTFGVEKIDPGTREAVLLGKNGKNLKISTAPGFDDEDRKFYPEGYERAYKFEDLGGSKDDSNFIAVVHIDGNGMGKRLGELADVHIDGNGMGKRLGELAEKSKKESWESYREKLKKFSFCIAKDYKDAFKEMCNCVKDKITTDGKLGDITLKKTEEDKCYFPIRRIISEGDDICFVTEGRIGIECARIFLEIISKKINEEDDKNYSACAGVAIVHQKYPFYRAYELSEKLCSNAKKFVANSTKNYEEIDASSVCAIDWHLEFGEMEDGIENIRKQYITADQKRMELRPYVVIGPEDYMKKERARDYRTFREVMRIVNSKENNYARGKIKELRNVIRSGEATAKNYMKANRIKNFAQNCYALYADSSQIEDDDNYNLFVKTEDDENRSILFDAIELSDTFISLGD